MRTENFRWTCGKDLFSFFDAPILLDPPAYRHYFCRTCGSPVPAALEGQPTVCIPTGLVEGEMSDLLITSGLTKEQIGLI